MSHQKTKKNPHTFRRVLSCETARGDTMPSSDDQQRGGSFLRQTLRGDFTFKSRRKTLHPVRAFLAMHVWLGLFHLNALIVFALLFSLNDRPSIRNGLIAVYAVVCVFPNKKPYPKWGLRVANHIVHAAQQYFPLRNKHIEEEKHLKLVANGTPVLIGLEPHGVLPLQMAAIADYYLFDGAIRTARDHACFKNEGERQRLRDAFAVSSAFASSSIFYVPLVRHLWPWLGLDPISRYHVKKVLSNGGVAIIVPGGVSEVLKMEKEREVVYLRKRYGFVKIAIQTGAALMPAYAFGATRTYSWWRLGPPLMTKKLAERISKILLFAPIVFWGRFFGPCPRKGALVTVYGPPIEVKQTDEPTQEYVREVLDRFIEGMEKVYYENRDEFGYKDVELVIE